ncbi:MAG: hypothetical protein ACP5G6_06260 [Conexivisphaera sp.]
MDGRIRTSSEVEARAAPLRVAGPSSWETAEELGTSRAPVLRWARAFANGVSAGRPGAL